MNPIDKKTVIDIHRMTLGSLCLYRNLLADPVIAAYRTLLDSTVPGTHADPGQFIERYSEFFNNLSTADTNVDFSKYIFDKILLDENAFSISAAKNNGEVSPAVYSAACSDLRALKAAASITPASLKECFPEDNRVNGCSAIIEGLPEWTAEKWFAGDKLWQLWGTDASIENLVNALKEYHTVNGYGLFSRKYAFTWQRSPSGKGCLVPVRNPDPVKLSDLIAYESEREEVVKNTEQFLDGYVANNVLLYGDRGTGKSSTVKALLNEYHNRGLRIVEVPRLLLADFPKITGTLAQSPYKFILFIDDLSFEDNEDSYTALKAVIEGGLEAKPQNVLIYATSNRRHLVREHFSDRLGLQYGNRDDEIRAIDTMQEKLSLSDRFGITVIFASPDKKRFLEIVDKLAQKKGIGLDPETLHKEALKWELWYNGRSPRTAQQFINDLSGRTK